MGDLPRMKPSVNRHDADSGGPAREHKLKHLGAIFHPQYDAISVIAATLPQRIGDAADALS
jgi:hypothetical protein